VDVMCYEVKGESHLSELESPTGGPSVTECEYMVCSIYSAIVPLDCLFSFSTSSRVTGNLIVMVSFLAWLTCTMDC
jgi:hypothetical protein